MMSSTNASPARRSSGARTGIPVAAGAGGHAGTLSPFALMQEIRAWFDGPVALSGAITHGRSILAAQALGADLAYFGSAFIATREANAVDAYKQAVVDGHADDIIYSSHFTGIHGNYLRTSIERAGIDPDSLTTGDPARLNFSSADNIATKAWKDIWGSGQGIGVIDAVQPAADLIARLTPEYQAAKAKLCRPG
jgi:nitronate monooxygenase